MILPYVYFQLDCLPLIVRHRPQQRFHMSESCTHARPRPLPLPLPLPLRHPRQKHSLLCPRALPLPPLSLHRSLNRNTRCTRRCTNTPAPTPKTSPSTPTTFCVYSTRVSDSLQLHFHSFFWCHLFGSHCLWGQWCSGQATAHSRGWRARRRMAAAAHSQVLKPAICAAEGGFFFFA